MKIKEIKVRKVNEQGLRTRGASGDLYFTLLCFCRFGKLCFFLLDRCGDLLLFGVFLFWAIVHLPDEQMEQTAELAALLRVHRDELLACTREGANAVAAKLLECPCSRHGDHFEKGLDEALTLLGRGRAKPCANAAAEPFAVRRGVAQINEPIYRHFPRKGIVLHDTVTRAADVMVIFVVLEDDTDDRGLRQKGNELILHRGVTL